jgi:hypothetical protein
MYALITTEVEVRVDVLNNIRQEIRLPNVVRFISSPAWIRTQDREVGGEQMVNSRSCVQEVQPLISEKWFHYHVHGTLLVNAVLS